MSSLKSVFRPQVFTGYHMLGVLVLFFGVIIAVNLAMARYAISTWTGLVVPNSYVASQEFNEKAAESRAISALGYQVRLSAAPGEFRADLADRNGAPISSDRVEIAFHHPVGQVGDRSLTLVPRGHGRFQSQEGLPEGEWIAVVTVLDGERTIYRKAHRIHVMADGTLRK